MLPVLGYTGRRRKELATLDYERKDEGDIRRMQASIELTRVAMTVMFTHKKADAWDTLGAIAIGVGVLS